MASKIVEYRITSASKLIRGPETGLLYLDAPQRRGQFVANSARMFIATGIALKVPSGLMVSIEGLYQHLCKGLIVTPQELFHVDEFVTVDVHIWNAANATLELPIGEPIAKITVNPLAQPVRWGEASDLMGAEQPEEEQQANG